jgi:hypothetical protein
MELTWNRIGALLLTFMQKLRRAFECESDFARSLCAEGEELQTEK